MFDTHMHCTFSVDSKMLIEEALQAAKKQNIGIVITEHMDIDYPTNPQSFLFDVPEYFKAFSPYRSDKLLLGIEIGLQTGCHAANSSIVKGAPFDMVIGSIHVAGGVDVYMEGYYKGRSKREAYDIYWQDMLACVRDYQDYDTLGHIDYISRYATYLDTNLDIAEAEHWAEICQHLIDNGKALEINTRRLDEKTAVSSLQPFYALYKDLGGKYVTLGSDAHRPNEVGRRIVQAYDWAESLGLLPVYFKERELVQDKR